jgi:hypothetical protein
MPRRRKRFNSEKSAKAFAQSVNGQVNDLRHLENAKSPFTVTYTPTDKTRAHFIEQDWCPEEGRDFGWPNSFWK